LLKIKPRIIGLDESKDPSFSKGDLRGLSAPQVLLKNSVRLRVYSVKLCGK
jgi:hypothetical protein